MVSMLIKLVIMIAGFFILILTFGSADQYKNLTNLVPKVISNKVLISAGLDIGSSGDEVRIIQSALSMNKNIYPSGIISGYFGNLTKQAVINFQKKYKILESGKIDADTAKKFNEIYGDKNKEYYLSLYPTQTVVKINLPDDQINQSLSEWGKAKQISEHGWTMNVGYDAKMATPQEILTALNTYRQRHGRSSLNWDDRLANYATQRAKYFTQINDLDEHAGFSDYLKNEENFKNLGFWSLGENSSFGYRLEATHLIEWIYAGDPPHNDNQLNSDWTHVGIGVDGYQTNLIFGGNQM